MNRVLDKLSSIPKDKLLHIFYGTCIYLLCSFINPLFAIIFTSIVAITKEAYDEFIYGGFDWKDIVATVAIPMILFLRDYNVY